MSEAFATGDERLITVAIGTAAKARGMAAVASDSGLSRENLYRALGEGGHPEFSTVMKVLNSLGVQLEVKPKIEEAEAA